MGTLTHCMTSVGLSDREKSILKQAAEENLRVNGDQGPTGAIRAAVDYFREIETERGSLAEQIQKLGGEVPAGVSLADLAKRVKALQAVVPVQEEEVASADVAADSTFNQEELDEDPFVRYQRLSARIPEGKGVKFDVKTDVLATDYDTLKTAPKHLEKAVNAIAAQPGFKDIQGDTVEQKAEGQIERMKRNLLYLFDQVPEEIRQRSKKWYEGASKIADDWSQKYEITKAQASGILATLSPQKDWFQNVTLAERIIDVMKTKQDHKFDRKMKGAAFQFLVADQSKIEAGKDDAPKNLESYAKVKNMTLKEAVATKDPLAIGMWLRAYDEAYHSAGHAIIHPEGGIGQNQKTAGGEMASRAWGGFEGIGKAASIFLDGSPENISRNIGGEHKVRNFYNNIFAPEDDRFTTIDTHAVAADMLLPLSGNSQQVSDNFGSAGQSAATGLAGTYALHHEAYRRAAAERGIIPREMQSITWEAVRGMFPEDMKHAASKESKKDKDAGGPGFNQFDRVWERVSAGEITEDQARAEIQKITGPIHSPDWFNEQGDTTTDREKTYSQDREGFQGNTVTFDPAPNPDDKERTAAWDDANFGPENEPVYEFVWKTALKVLGSMNKATAKGELVQQMGGFEGHTNPSFSLQAYKYMSMSDVKLFARALGHVLGQKSMMVSSPAKFKGGEQWGYALVEGVEDQQAREVYDELRGALGDDRVSGHTTKDGKMVIMTPVGTEDQLAQDIAGLLGDRHDVKSGSDMYVEFIGEEDYGLQGTDDTEGVGADASLRGKLRDLREAALAERDRLVANAGTAEAESGDREGQGEPAEPGDREADRDDAREGSEVERLKAAIMKDAEATGHSPEVVEGIEEAAPPDGYSPFAQTMEDLFGVKVQFVKTKGLPRSLDFNGAYVTGRTVFINEKAQEPHAKVIGHEFLHQLKQNKSDLYDNFVKVARPLMTKRAKDAAKLEAAGYERTGRDRKTSLALGEEEVFADTFGEYFGDKTFWNDLAVRAGREERGVIGRALSALKDFLVKILEGITGRDLTAFYKDEQTVREGALDATLGAINRRVKEITDLRQRIADAGQEDAPQAPQEPAKEGEEGEAKYSKPKTAWDMPVESRIDDITYYLQDKNVDLRRVVENIRKFAGSIDPRLDADERETTFSGRVHAATKAFLNDSFRPLVQEMAMRGVNTKELDEYLGNRHAESRNKQIAKINPAFPDGGSGIKTADARKYLNSLDPQRKKILEALALKVDSIVHDTEDYLVDTGQETQDTIDNWRRVYPDYVPMYRAEIEEVLGAGTGRGFDIRGDFSKRAMGSNKPVANILAHVAMARERAIMRAEKNRVAVSLMGLALKYPNPDFWELDKPPMERKVVERNGKEVVEMKPEANFHMKDNVIHARIKGQDHYLVFNKSNFRAMRMAKSLKNVDVDQLGTVMKGFAKITRFFAAINTQYNPVFGAVNFIRDFQAGMLHLGSTPLAGQKKKVAGYTVDALRGGVFQAIRDQRQGKTLNTKNAWAGWLERYEKAGGKVGFSQMFSTADDRAKAIENEIKDIGKSNGLKKGGEILGWLSDYNETAENAVRLAAFRAAVEKFESQGMATTAAEQKAAVLAKNLTVNFNRKGQISTQANALYAFFNASVQGSARMAETMFEFKGGQRDFKNVRLSPLGKKILLGGILLGVSQAVLLSAMGMGGDDGPEEWIKQRALIIPGKDKNYVAIPMPLGFHMLVNLGRIPTEMVQGGFKNKFDHMINMVQVMLDGFNPLGSATLAQTLSPSITDIPIALAENKDWAGRDISLEPYGRNDRRPGHKRAKDSASPWARILSEGLNTISGGSDHRPGRWSPTPDQIDYVIEQLGGGIMREATKAGSTFASQVTGEEIPAYKVPFSGRFIGNLADQAAIRSRFYKHLNRINDHEAEIKGMRKDGKPDDEIFAYKSRHPDSRLIDMGNAAEKRLRKLRDDRRDAVKEGDKARVKSIEQEITSVMSDFNERYARMLELKEEVSEENMSEAEAEE